MARYRKPRERSGINGWGRPLVQKRCFTSGKISFDKKGAQTAANKRWAEDHVQLRIYECRCGGWHLTSRL